jgi:nucleoside-diphosphate-sugar epimerase
VFVSTTDVYGLRDFRGEAEDELPLVDNRRNPYPRYKIRAEAWVREHLPPDRYAIVRPAAVWGPHDPTLTPRVLGFLRCSPVIVHFGPHRGRNRWPLAHVRNVALALFLAATRAEAAGQAVNVLDDEWTSVDDWYRLLAERFLPGRRFRRVCLPVAAGLALGTPVSALARLLDRSRPLLDPSRYAVYTVSSDLDFSNRRLRDLVRDSGERLLSRDQGLEGLM